ncbi:hypothetical protein BKH33_06265 [Actinomyces naeslundii]|uniref:Uncharacterized protein n=1 Tax=Actinomyces naeslundii TaxID=1655 RepID=A0A854D5U8_ACTNA|nr:hypothetical protein BKH33_06265 [Actinomyces naeslundii]
MVDTTPTAPAPATGTDGSRKEALRSLRGLPTYSADFFPMEARPPSQSFRQNRDLAASWLLITFHPHRRSRHQ